MNKAVLVGIVMAGALGTASTFADDIGAGRDHPTPSSEPPSEAAASESSYWQELLEWFGLEDES